MINLTNLEEIKKIDSKNVYRSTEMFNEQCEQVWQDAKNIQFPENFKNVHNIILAGMGGSSYGGYVVQTLFKGSLKIPLIVNNDYHLPDFANQSSLVILSSYSGLTEEILSCSQEAKNKNAKITGITSGGKLDDFLKIQNIPYLQFNPKFNPSDQPRLATGYMVLGFIALLNNLGFLNVSNREINSSIEDLKNSKDYLKKEAVRVARELQGYIPVIFTAEFLNGNAHILRNQFNETSKTFSVFSEFPELNHHLMEGLKNPKDRKLKILLIVSDNYSPKIKRRIELTKDVIIKNGISLIEYEAKGDYKLTQVLKTLFFGGYVTFYLAMLYGQDPGLIPWVDYFKKELSKS